MNEEDVEMEEQEAKTKIKFQIANQDLSIMQNSNFAISKLKQVIEKKLPPRQWKVPAISKYKRYVKDLTVQDEILVRQYKEGFQAVVSYPLMVELLYKLHTKTAHMGRHKFARYRPTTVLASCSGRNS